MACVGANLANVGAYAPVSNFAYPILKRCLPGAYTFVLPATRNTPRMLQTKQKTVGLRVPDHPVPLALASGLGNPVISTSANYSNDEVLTDPYKLETTLGNQVDLILECGELPVLPSSVVSLVGDQVDILRPGSGDLTLFEEA